MNYFIILSEGSYSDYSPNYYMGEKEITQEELKKKGIEVGDKLIEEYEKYPERDYVKKYEWETKTKEKYNPKTGGGINNPTSYKWIKLMEKWLLEEMEYKSLPDDIPEINCYYNFPSTNNPNGD